MVLVHPLDVCVLRASLARKSQTDRYAISPLTGGEGGHPPINVRLRIRDGDYRVVYFVDAGKLVVTIIAAAHRRPIHRNL